LPTRYNLQVPPFQFFDHTGFHHVINSEKVFGTHNHQELIDGTEAIAHSLKKAGYRVFALTDNVHEIVAHLKWRHQFWNLFEGAVVSAEIGLMKPNPAIFRHAAKTFDVAAGETVFLDDVQANVDGARSTGMEPRVFTMPSRCGEDLRALGLVF
jgi:putative hydrolase of the HAD superfamily